MIPISYNIDYLLNETNLSTTSGRGFYLLDSFYQLLAADQSAGPIILMDHIIYNKKSALSKK